VIEPPLVTDTLPVAVIAFSAMLLTSLIVILPPVAPSVIKSFAEVPRVIVLVVLLVPALSVTTEPVVFAMIAAAPCVIVPLVDVPLVLIETAPVVDATAGAMVRVPVPERMALPPLVRTSKPPPARGVPTRFTLTGPVLPMRVEEAPVPKGLVVLEERT